MLLLPLWPHIKRGRSQEEGKKRGRRSIERVCVRERERERERETERMMMLIRMM